MEKKFQLKLINMKTYTATSQNSRNFILENENQEILGELIYPKWYSTKAEIHVGSKIFKTDTKDSLKTLMHQFELNKQYYVSYYIAFVPIIVCSYIILFEYLPTYQHQKDFAFILFFGFTVFFGILFLYLIGKWWFNYFYGKYINQIENILNELK